MIVLLLGKPIVKGLLLCLLFTQCESDSLMRVSVAAQSANTTAEIFALTAAICDVGVGGTKEKLDIYDEIALLITELILLA